MVKYIKAPNPKEQGPYVIIEDWDFDEKKHGEYVFPAKGPEPLPEPAPVDPNADEFDAMSDGELRVYIAKISRPAAKTASRETLLEQARALKALS